MSRPYKNVIYMDESGFNNWLHTERSWMRPSERINVILPKQRVGGVTLFGAIGDALVKPVFMTASSTTIAEFTRFIPKIVE